MNLKKEVIIIRGESAVHNGEVIYYSFCLCFCGFVKIYTLSDKKGDVFYVGCITQELEKRLSQHLIVKGYSGLFNVKKSNKIIELNYEVIINLIEQRYVAATNGHYARKEMFERENFWIRKHKELGYDLCNVKSVY